ncbi:MULTISPECIES: nuclear transport factor 2 family protein [unclassified Pseudomonas]|uniref:nuclear transport factor 2 family protein n=1 Tax=unclassified Pseudomonas TaxID=196821 RepID=UPI0035C132BC
MTATELVHAYYAAFNAGDMPAFLALLSEDVIHDINQGERQMGKAAFTRFMDKMNRCYRERLADIVVMQNSDGSRAAAEFTVHGQYLADDEGLPAAQGQRYVLSAGAFFYIHCGKIARVTNYYNLSDWVEQVG